MPLSWDGPTAVEVAPPHSPATRSPTGSAPPKDRRKYCDPGEQDQEEGGDVPEGGQYHHAE
jgi:hypothetical protein